MSVQVAYTIGGSARYVTLDMPKGSTFDDLRARISNMRKVPIERVFIMRAKGKVSR